MKAVEREDTIVALSSPPGVGAIALIRMSGRQALSLMKNIFRKDLSQVPSHSAHYGVIRDGERMVDEGVVIVFRGPNSYTGEDMVEISCHGSPYIQQEILQLLSREGARLARPGEFSLRAFLNGKLDLTQAEAVNDLIEAQGHGAHELAMRQLRGGVSREIGALRDELVHFASLIELELDFAEEDVEFANRNDLMELVRRITTDLQRLLDSFALGNAIKTGVPVAIVGRPNAGKSTLLNVLLNEERAIVSPIAGTTRDTIEDVISIGGIQFRFIDTAGLRESGDDIEVQGIQRTLSKIRESAVVIYLYDVNEVGAVELAAELASLKEQRGSSDFHLLAVGNKAEHLLSGEMSETVGWPLKQGEVSAEARPQSDRTDMPGGLFISAKHRLNIEELRQSLLQAVGGPEGSRDAVLLTNVRHYEALSRALAAMNDVLKGLETGISGEFLAIDIRRSLQFLGEVSGSISTEELLSNIFGRFCIGK